MTRWAGVVAVMAGALVACNGDSGGQASREARAAHFVELPRGPWTQLAQRLVQAPSAEDAVATTREVLARGGVATRSGSTVLVAPQGPVSAFAATPMETVHLAIDARRKPTMGRMDTAELAQMLEAFGWPFADANPRREADGPLPGGLDREDAREMQQADQAARAAAVAERSAARDAERARLDALRESMVGPAQAEAARALAERIAANDAHRQAAAADKPAARARLLAAGEALNAARKAQAEARREFQAISQAHNDAQWQESQRQSTQQQVARLVGPDYRAGEQLTAFLAAWVNEAAKHPDDPRSFTPLFLAEMARLQAAPVDLAGAARASPLLDDEDQPLHRIVPGSAQMHWTLLELQLFAAAFHRDERASASRSPLDAAAALAGVLVPVAHAATPCSDIKQSMGPDLGELHGIGVSETTGHVLDGVLETGFGKAGAEAIGNALAATAIVGKIIKVAAFYSQNQVTVGVEPGFLHKPASGYTPATFTATAGVDPKELAEYDALSKKMAGADQAYRDCMGWAGFPTPTTIAEVAADAENWLIDWRIVEGGGSHAVWSPRDNDFYLKGVRQATKMRRVSPSSAEANYVVRVLPDGGHQGRTRKGLVVVRAEVDAAGMPSLGTLISAGKGLFGVADALVEIASGWVMVAFKPKAYAALEVEYHCPRPTTIHHYVKNPVAHGGGEGGDACTFEFQTKEEFEKWRGLNPG